jgi:ABC-type molybdenum transport system ATPase subunit/photorepair protein PhrA
MSIHRTRELLRVAWCTTFDTLVSGLHRRTFDRRGGDMSAAAVHVNESAQSNVALLEIKRLALSYDGRAVLNNFDLKVDEGEFVHAYPV